MKVLYFIDSLRFGGKERRLAELLKGIEAQKWVTTELAVMSRDIAFSSVKESKIKIHFLIRKSKKDPRIFGKLFNVCKAFQPDLIHCWESMPVIYAVPVAKLLRIKLINGMITTAPPARVKAFEQRWVRSRLTFPFSDAIVSNSLAGLKSFGAPREKSYCVHNGFDFSRLQKLADAACIRNKFGLKTRKIVGMVARFSVKKDYATFVLAAQRILRRRDDVTFLAVGSGSTLNKIKAMVEDDFKDRIKFLGSIDEVESVINVFDIGVLATAPGVGEGISNSIMEYMALAKPVVATRGGGTDEIVADRVTGFLVPPGDVDALTDSIERLLNNEDQAQALGKVGKARLQKEFSLKKMTESYLNLYHECLGNGGYQALASARPVIRRLPDGP